MIKLSHVLSFVVLVASVTSHAEELRGFQEQEKLLRDTPALSGVSNMDFGDEVDYSTGATRFRVTDVSLPGNNAIPVEFSRVLDASERFGASESYEMYDWSIDIPRLEGVFAAGYPWQTSDPQNPNNRCAVSSFEVATPPPAIGAPDANVFQPFEFWSGTQLSGIDGGSEPMLLIDQPGQLPTDGEKYYWRTKSGWMFSCLDTLKNGGPGQGFRARSPNGLTYYFDYWTTRRYRDIKRIKPAPVGVDEIDVPVPGPYTLGRVQVRLMVSKIEDRFGNFVEFSYNGNRLLEISSGTENERRISLHYSNESGKLDRVSDPTHEWRYEYSENGVLRQLRQVVQPDGSTWTYQGNSEFRLEYEPIDLTLPQHICNPRPGAGPMEYTVTAPSGSQGVFKFAPVAVYRFVRICTAETAPRHIWRVGLTEKSVTGTQVSGITNIDLHHEMTPSRDDVRICLDNRSCPITRAVDVSQSNGDFVRYTYGAREGVDEGLLLKQEEGRSVGGVYSASAVKRTTTYAYQPPTLPIGFLPKAGTSPYRYGDWFMAENHIPLVRRDVVQDGVTFTWRATSFDAYVNPTAITRSSSLGWSKSETRAYRHFPAFWLMSQPQSVTDVASGVVESAWFYWSTTGQLSTVRQFGIADGTRSYNLDGTLSTHLLPEGNTLQYSDWYRGVPRLVANLADQTSSSAVVSSTGKIISITDETGATTGFEYDPMGRIKKITPPTGDSTTWSNTDYIYERLTSANYGISGSYWRSTETTGARKREIYYDALWRPILERTYDSGAPTLARFIRYDYDSEGNLVFKSYPGYLSVGSNYRSGLTAGISTRYDALSRVTEQTASSELGTLTTTTDYLSNFVTRTTNPRGYVTEQQFKVYDDPSQAWPVSLTQAKGFPEQIDTVIARDAWGKPTSITRSGWYRGVNPAEFQSLTRRFVYDGNQRLCKQYDPESSWRVIDYTASNAVYWVADGQSLSSTTDCQRSSVPSSAKIIRSYNTRGMLTGIAYPDSTDDALFTYWPDGALYTATVGSGANAKAWTYQYNKRRLLTGETLTLDGRSFSLNYRFNGMGQVSQAQYPDAEWATYSPNVFGEPTQVGSVASAAAYSRFGGLTGFTYGNGLVYDATENSRGLIETQRWRNGSMALLHYGYTYDQHGNLATQDDYVGSMADYHNEGRSLGYDGLDRMTVANSSPQPPLRAPTPWTYSWGDGQMGYDALDNLRSYALAAIDFRYEHDANNRPRRIVFGGSTFRNYSYNARGQMTYRDHDTGGQTLAWDSANRLLSINGVGGNEQYAYDAHGHRVRSSKSGETRYQMYSRAGQLMYDESTSGERRKYYYLGGRLVGQTEGASGELRYLLTDRQGSVRAKTNASRVINYETVRGPYGSVLLGWSYQNGPALAGHMEDAISGLTYMEARYYDPVAMRFISPDPVGVSGDGGNFNRYWYANNNPYTNIDPDGRLARGAGFTDAEWKRFDNAQQRAAGNLERAAAKITEALSRGKRLSGVTRSFERAFGEGSGTAANMTSVASAMSGMAAALRDTGASAIVANGMTTAQIDAAYGGSNSRTLAAVPTNGPVQVIVNTSHADFGNASRLSWAAGHETAHAVHGYQDARFDGAKAYKFGSLEQREAFKNFPGSMRLTNPDHLMDYAQ